MALSPAGTPRTLPPAIATATAIALAALAACDSGPTGVADECNPDTGAGCDPPPAAACDPQLVPAGRSCVLWKRGETARELIAADTFDILVIDAGTEVRAAEGVQLVASQLLIRGTESAPVLFRPLAAGSHWGGIVIPGYGPDSSSISHVRIETAQTGISATSPVRIEHLHVEDIQGIGVLMHGGELIRSVIDGAGGSGVVIGSNSAVRMEGTIVRGAATGIELPCVRCRLHISGGTIEDNEGDGIRVRFGDPRTGTVIFEAPVRIAGNGGHPLVIPLVSMRGVMNDVAAQSDLLGTGRDTIVAFAGSTWGAGQVPEGDLTIRKTLPFRVVVPCPGGLPPMVMEAGALLTVQGGACAARFAMQMPTLLGTAAEPVTIAGDGVTMRLTTAGVDTAVLRHARFRGVRLVTLDDPVVIDEVVLNSSTLVITYSGSRITNVWSTGGGSTGPYEYQQEAAVTLGGDVRLEDTRIEGALHHAVHITGGSPVVTRCTVRLNAGHGVWVEQGTLRIEQCSLEENAGLGIHNSTPDTVEATYNWWGDPAGPRGTNGDGIDGPVRYIPFLTSPAGSSAGMPVARPLFALSTALEPRREHRRTVLTPSLTWPHAAIYDSHSLNSKTESHTSR